jgi:predicted DCC family thiol-disulfide oxidoreductase YuxK
MMSKSILFYDGDCSLCNKTVQFIINHEKQVETPIFFCSLQSAYAKQSLSKYNYNFNQLNTLVLLTNDNVYYKSNAALYVTKFLKAPYSWGFIFKIIPLFIRDSVYDYIAMKRKHLIKTPYCYTPTPLLKNRFIE